jgi:hypothetical protein
MSKRIKVPFEVRLAATACDPVSGEPLDSQFVETVQIEVIDNGQHQFLTEEAHLIIDKSRIQGYFKHLIKDATHEEFVYLSKFLHTFSYERCHKNRL